MMLVLCVHPSAARLSESKFVPFSKGMGSCAEDQTKLHQIKKGDTLCRIARQNNVDLKSVMQINDMDYDTVLEIGATIKIPTQEPGAVHVVAPGETMASLARRYEVNIVDLMTANQAKNPLALEIGDYLVIPAGPKADEADAVTPSRGAKLTGYLAWPVTGTISSGYGQRKSGFHHGLDIANEVGTPIRSAESGTVIFAGTKPVYGRTVIIDHPDGKQTLYAHAKSINVSEGDEVDRGEVIAYVGVSGVTTGPHLHFEVRVNKKTGNPLKYLR
ncbi:MAG: M23 family metallopeptidase [Syntrophomonadaceae bacterium]